MTKPLIALKNAQLHYKVGNCLLYTSDAADE